MALVFTSLLMLYFSETVYGEVTSFKDPIKVDSTNKISPRVTSFDAPPYSDDPTYAIWSNPNLGQEPSSTADIIHVYNWDQFQKAVGCSNFTVADGNDPVDNVPYFNKRNAPYIKLMEDIDSGDYANAAGFLTTTKNSFVVDGNGFKLNTGRYSVWLTGTSATSRGMYLKNLTMYSTTPYGSFCNETQPNRYIVYDNITYEGSQLTASYRSTLIFKGVNQAKSAYKTYDVTMHQGTPEEYTRTATNNGTATVASGLEAHRAFFMAGSDTKFDAGTGDALIIGAYVSNWESTSPYAYLESNAKLDLKTSSDGGESYGYNATGGRVVNAGANIQNGGSLVLEDGASMNVDVTGTHRAGVRLTGGSASRRTAVTIGKDATLNILTDGPTGSPWAAGTTGIQNVSQATFPYYSGLTLDSFSDINLSNENATLNLNMKNAQYQWNASLGYAQGIRIDSNSTIKVASKAKFNLNMDGSYGSALKMVGANSNFIVEDEGDVSFNMQNQASANSNVLQVENGTFKIGKKGIFDMKVSDGNGIRNLFYVGAGSFTFSDAMRVDLDAQANDNVQLVNMVGTFNADIQAVYAWNKGNAVSEKTSADFEWIPIFNAKVTYARSGTNINTTSVSADTITQTTKTSFINNYQTEDFNRVLFEWIPDVEVTTDEVSDNELIVSGQQLSGKTNPLSMVTFYLTKASGGAETKLAGASIANEVDDWKDNAARNFHVKADAGGNFTFPLPEDVTLYVGDKIRMHSYRNGKEAEASTDVLDKTAPEANGLTYYMSVGDVPPAAAKFIDSDSVKDKGVVPPVWNASYHSTNSIADITTMLSTEGSYPIKIDIADEAKEADGSLSPNTRTVDAVLKVYPASNGVKGNDLQVPYKDIRNLTEAQLASYILSHSEATAYKIENGKLTDLTDKIQVTNFGSLNNIAGLLPNTQYPVTLTVKSADSGLAEDISTVIKVEVIEMDAILKVEFKDETGSVLPGYTITIADIFVGDTIDLTTNTDVQNQVQELIDAGYQIINKPTSENSISIDSTEVTVQYEISGQLFLKSAPSLVDFRSIKYDAHIKRVDDPTVSGDLIVTDTRANKIDGWTLFARVTEPMTNTAIGSSSILTDSLRYVTNKTEIILNSGNQAVYHELDGGNQNITQTWGTSADDDGLKLVVDPSISPVKDGSYKGMITWEIMAGTP